MKQIKAVISLFILSLYIIAILLLYYCYIWNYIVPR